MTTKSPSGDEVPHEIKVSGALCVAFANTLAPRRDGRQPGKSDVPWLELESYADLLAWGRRISLLEADDEERLRQAADADPDKAAEALARGRHLRHVLLYVFTLLVGGKPIQPEDLDGLNAVLRQALAARRVVMAGDGFHWDSAAGPAALESVLWPVAESAAELLTSGEYRRLRQCAANGCLRLFLGRNPRRRWCDMNVCGSRLKGHRQRKSKRRFREAQAYRRLLHKRRD